MKLTGKKRSGMPRSQFAGPGKSFPVNDRSYNAGNISKGEETKIKSKARGLLGGIKK